MIEPIRALTARIVRSSTWERRSSIFGIFAAISTTSFSAPSLKTRSSRRSVEPRSSVSMRLNACAMSPISVTSPRPDTTFVCAGFAVVMGAVLYVARITLGVDGLVSFAALIGAVAALIAAGLALYLGLLQLSGVFRVNELVRSLRE